MEALERLKWYKGKRVLVTGSTGFKGSWLCQWLISLGATVLGIGKIPVSEQNHYDLLGLGCSKFADMNHYSVLKKIVAEFKPDIVFHLAANAIVANTFNDPRGTIHNNTLVTLNILESCRVYDPNMPMVMITTDKVYQDKGWSWGYREEDQLLGLDPYSASKVACEQIITCYRTQFMPNIATARAGNVIGGGDWSEKRLIPDIIRSAVAKEPVEIHTPAATRPWQHVLEALRGYLLLGQHLGVEATCNSSLTPKVVNMYAKPWNFGPTEILSVYDVAKIAQLCWPGLEIRVVPQETHPSMVKFLRIDSSEADEYLGWRPLLPIQEAVQWSIEWYRGYYMTGNLDTMKHIYDYEKEMKKNG